MGLKETTLGSPLLMKSLKILTISLWQILESISVLLRKEKVNLLNSRRTGSVYIAAVNVLFHINCAILHRYQCVILHFVFDFNLGV